MINGVKHLYIDCPENNHIWLHSVLILCRSGSALRPRHRVQPGPGYSIQVHHMELCDALDATLLGLIRRLDFI